MGKLRFGVWIPTYAWKYGGPEQVRRVTDSIKKCEAHRSYEHLQECYLIRTIDRINARIADLVGAGLQYLVLGPVTDDPGQLDLLARHVVPSFA